jgi:hypothetical protein
MRRILPEFTRHLLDTAYIALTVRGYDGAARHLAARAGAFPLGEPGGPSSQKARASDGQSMKTGPGISPDAMEAVPVVVATKHRLSEKRRRALLASNPRGTTEVMLVVDHVLSAGKACRACKGGDCDAESRGRDVHD